MHPSESAPSSLVWYRLSAALLLLVSLFFAFFRPLYATHNIFWILNQKGDALTVNDVALGLSIANQWLIPGLAAGLAGIAILFWKGRIQFTLLPMLGFFLILNGLLMAGPWAAYCADAEFHAMMKGPRSAFSLEAWNAGFYPWVAFGSYSLAGGVVLFLLNYLFHRGSRENLKVAATSRARGGG